MPECAPGPKSAAPPFLCRPDGIDRIRRSTTSPHLQDPVPSAAGLLRCAALPELDLALASSSSRRSDPTPSLLWPPPRLLASPFAAAPPSPTLAVDAPAFSASVRASPDPLRPTSPGVAALSRVGLAPVSCLVFEQRMNANPRWVDRASASLAATLRLGRILPARKPAQPITEPACFSSAARTGPKPMFPLQCEDSFDYNGSSTSWTRSSSLRDSRLQVQVKG